MLEKMNIIDYQPPCNAHSFQELMELSPIQNTFHDKKKVSTNFGKLK
jgi:hypothetical protein